MLQGMPYSCLNTFHDSLLQQLNSLACHSKFSQPAPFYFLPPSPNICLHNSPPGPWQFFNMLWPFVPLFILFPLHVIPFSFSWPVDFLLILPDPAHCHFCEDLPEFHPTLQHTVVRNFLPFRSHTTVEFFKCFTVGWYLKWAKKLEIREQS